MTEPEDFEQSLTPDIPANVPMPVHSASVAPRLSPLACAWSVFYRPRRVFQSLAQRPTWWVPLVLLLALTTLFYFGTWSRIDIHQLIQKAQQHSNPQAWQFNSMPAAQRVIMENILTRSVQLSWILGPLLVLLYLAIESVFLFCLYRLVFHAEVSFRQVNAVVWHSSLPGMLPFLPLALKPFLGHALDSLQFKKLGYADLAYYFNPATTPRFLYGIASSINFFTLWTLLLLAVGLVVVGRTKRIHGAVSAAIWWFVRWIAIMILFLLSSMVLMAI